MRPTSTHFRLWFILSVVAVFYVCFYGVSFLADPFGQVPVLDARENLAWAAQIREGSLPAEPLYRALLYPFILSLLPEASLPVAATLLGLLLHLSSAVLVGLIARCLWTYRPAAWLAAVVYAVYPLSLYFAGQVLDMTLATTLFLAGLYCLLWVAQAQRAKFASEAATRWGRTASSTMTAGTSGRTVCVIALLSGFLGGLAVLARPNFLPAVILFPVVLYFVGSRLPKASLVLALGLGGMLMLQGIVNLKISDQFRLLPWQGAYNLYAANREGANGKYYTQQLSFDEVPAGANTTRMESEWLYRQTAGEDAPVTVDAMNAFWRAQLVERIVEDPVSWLGLMGRKAIFVLNNWEQYNNLSYAYHKARWPLLKWNPLGWGLLLMASFLGLSIAYREASRPALISIALLGLAYAGGLLLFFVSARFRLPLVPLLCIAVGGCAYWQHYVFTRRQYGFWLLGLGGLALLSFGNWFEAKDRTTFIQDEYLLARASSEVGDDERALELARAVLERDPQRVDAARMEVTSLFNLWLVTRQPLYWYDLEASLATLTSEDAATAFIRGVYLWRSLSPESAIDAWQGAVNEYGVQAQSSLNALQAVGQLSIEPEQAAAVGQIRAILDLEFL